MTVADHHFELLAALKEEKDPQRIKEICLEDIALAKEFARFCRKEYGKDTPLPPSYPSFKKLAILYEREKNYDAAMKVCKKAIAAGFPKDGTQGGMAARIEKLQLKKEGKK